MELVHVVPDPALSSLVIGVIAVLVLLGFQVGDWKLHRKTPLANKILLWLLALSLAAFGAVGLLRNGDREERITELQAENQKWQLERQKWAVEPDRLVREHKREIDKWAAENDQLKKTTSLFQDEKRGWIKTRDLIEKQLDLTDDASAQLRKAQFALTKAHDFETCSAASGKVISTGESVLSATSAVRKLLTAK